MGHPLIDEFCRVRGVASCQPNFFNRCQMVFKNEVQPMLEERERLIAERDRLVGENLSLKAKLETLQERATRRRQEAAV